MTHSCCRPQRQRHFPVKRRVAGVEAPLASILPYGNDLRWQQAGIRSCMKQG
jgi:hypothetical protein